MLITLQNCTYASLFDFITFITYIYADAQIYVYKNSSKIQIYVYFILTEEDFSLFFFNLNYFISQTNDRLILYTH